MQAKHGDIEATLADDMVVRTVQWNRECVLIFNTNTNYKGTEAGGGDGAMLACTLGKGSATGTRGCGVRYGMKFPAGHWRDRRTCEEKKDSV